ncbi:uncharacterized protein LOC132096933 [Carassius carassius]|uniref:uncharacterized protein LOC132096933 n=1 Tax=Carassius carassius TaxID=217509 RepID=UPI0028694AA8|nr:uncharacterized protein LOC132096933 [Carassius carassius]
MPPVQSNYKSYLLVTNKKIPRTTEYRHRKGKGRRHKQYKQYLCSTGVEVPDRILGCHDREPPVHHDAPLQPTAGKRKRADSKNGSAAEDDVVDIGEHQTMQEPEAERPNPNPSQDGNCGDDLLYPGAPITKGQSLLLLMAYVLRHNLTGIALDHLLRIFHELFPALIPATSYLFHKSYGQYGEYVPHFYCHQCSNYIGTKECGLTQCVLLMGSLFLKALDAKYGLFSAKS